MESIEAASITASKINEICKLLPELASEIDFSRGSGGKETKDKVVYVFHNGSVIDTLPPRESSRGQRRHSGIVEEAILVPEKELNEIIIPRLRRLWGIAW